MERNHSSCRFTDRMPQLFHRHPCICMLVFCLLTVILGFGDGANFSGLHAAAVWLAGNAVLLLGKQRIWKHPAELAVMTILWSGFCLWLVFTACPARWWITGAITALVLLWVYLYSRRRLTDGRSGFLLCCMGFCMRFAYVLATPYYIRQHDVGRFEGDSGHAAYIQYLFDKGHLPDFDVREVWQFYHPPLHHIIAAGWMKLLEGFGVSHGDACESVQILTLAYSCLCLVLFWQLLRHFHLKGAALLVPMGIMAFHPTFFLLAGSINNDMLSITFLLWAVLLTCRWYRDPKLSTILQLAVAIGCGMMTKLSVWMAAPAAAVVFLAVLYRNRKHPLPLIGQYAAFGAVCIPLGLWWGIRNLLRFGVPIAYVPMLSANSAQYVGQIPVWQRLLDFSPKQWTYVYDCFEMYGQPYNEYNPLIGLLKTALFDELINTDSFPAIAGFGELLFLSQVLIAALSVIAIIVVICRRSTNLEHWHLLLTYGITLASYYSFCVIYAHTCTQNIRYATPLIFIGCLLLGLWLQKGERTAPSGILQKVVCIPAVLFMVSSCAVYTCVCSNA